MTCASLCTPCPGAPGIRLSAHLGCTLWASTCMTDTGQSTILLYICLFLHIPPRESHNMAFESRGGRDHGIINLLPFLGRGANRCLGIPRRQWHGQHSGRRFFLFCFWCSYKPVHMALVYFSLAGSMIPKYMARTGNCQGVEDDLELGEEGRTNRAAVARVGRVVAPGCP